MTSDFDPNSCPVGISNEKEIYRLGDKLDMAIERLTEKVSEIKEDVASLSDNMDKKFESVDKKFDEMNHKIDDMKKEMPELVHDEIDRERGADASAAIRWVLTGVVGSVIIALATSYFRNKLGL